MHAFSDCVVGMPPLVAWLYTRTFLLFYTERSTPLWRSTVGTLCSLFHPYYDALLEPFVLYSTLIMMHCWNPLFSITPLWWCTVGTLCSLFHPYYDALLEPFVLHYTLMVMHCYSPMEISRTNDCQRAAHLWSSWLPKHEWPVGDATLWSYDATKNKEAYYITQIVMIASCKAITSCEITSIKKIEM